jgi:hypothetical protein
MSSSHDFSSSTYDFIMGLGARQDEPTCEELAHALFVVTEELRRTGVLEDLIGEDRALSWTNCRLRDGIQERLSAHSSGLVGATARMIHEWHYNRSTMQLYVTDGADVPKHIGPLWYFVQFRANAAYDDGYITCEALYSPTLLAQTVSRGDLSAYPEGGRDTVFATLVALSDALNDKVAQRRRELEAMTEEATILKIALQRTRSIFESSNHLNLGFMNYA